MKAMSIAEAREAAQRQLTYWGDPVVVVELDPIWRDGDKIYGTRSFYRGQNVKVGTVFTTIGTIMNAYDVAVEIIDC